MVKICAPSPGWMLKTAITLVFAALAVGCTDVEYADGQSPQNPLDPEESSVVQKVNQLRASADAPALKVCFSLNVSASVHSDDMREKGYLDDNAPDGSDPVDRACDAGYKPACDNMVGMVEMVAKGNAEGAATFAQWSGDAGTRMLLLDPTFLVVGLGRAMSSDASAIWTLDMSTAEDPSCEAAAP
ncbi:CAP domain-containing protein [Polyangium aurulentum]|uniref:CAP domain-containing protein n=1 Tax=Polyangium aurulentum TaxID=2567896 RepID=UPI00146CC7E3|nr:CAP domain-containing protein [Polyangium aurulentum]UQA56552.1 hypothetical protein E8A73_035355 [Polyangium aurulentum]